jgi:hypothetical protein
LNQLCTITINNTIKIHGMHNTRVAMPTTHINMSNITAINKHTMHSAKIVPQIDRLAYELRRPQEVSTKHADTQQYWQLLAYQREQSHGTLHNGSCLQQQHLVGERFLPSTGVALLCWSIRMSLRMPSTCLMLVAVVACCLAPLLITSHHTSASVPHHNDLSGGGGADGEHHLE